MIQGDSDALMLAWTTCETESDASRLAQGAVEAKLAACVQVSGPVRSVYRWKGELENSPEYRLLFKTAESRLESLHAWIKDNHPYETPQFYALVADHVDEQYLRWVTDS